LGGVKTERWMAREYFPFRDYDCCVEVDLIKRDLGWRAKYRIDEGFRQTFGTYTVEELRERVLDTGVEDQILSGINSKY
jgi:dTDP-D-glucose 4,6-dehydratase